MADGKITLEELTKAVHDALTERNLRLGAQGAFYNVPEEPRVIELDMEAFNRPARAIAIRRERTAALMRNVRPLPTSEINNDGIPNSSVGVSDPSSPIAEPQLLASTPHLSAITPGCATEPPASVFTTGGERPLLQSYASPFSVAQSAHGQRPAAHEPLGILAQSQHWQANSTTFAEPQSTLQQQSIQPSVVQTTHGVCSELYN